MFQTIGDNVAQHIHGVQEVDPEVSPAEIDSEKAVRWVERHDGNLQSPLWEVMGNVHHVSFEVFQRELQTTLQDALEQLTKFYGRDFVPEKDAIVLVEGQKSNKWVAELALHYANFRPASYFRLGEKSAECFSAYFHARNAEELKVLSEDFTDKTIVLFDDGSYSGTQLSNHVSAVIKTVDRYTLPILAICLVVPYMTEVAQKRVRRECPNGPLFIGRCIRIATLHDLRRDTREALTASWYPGHENWLKNIGLTWFDHKIPNYMSFPNAVVHADVFDEDGNQCGKSSRFLGPITPPYK